MRAIGYKLKGPISADSSLEDISLARPGALGRDLLVEVKAISVNPVDTKVRQNVSAPEGEWKVLGWDCSGIVAEVGEGVIGFAPGDEVFYAGSVVRAGANAEFHVVDERIVAKKPSSLSFAEAAALPLTSITAWEAMFDRLNVERAVPGSLHAVVIVGGAGGVGSIAVQLARRLTDLTVIATASRPETQDWVRSLGAHHVIDHSKPLAVQVKELGLGLPGFVFSTTNTDSHFPEIVELTAPQGRIAVIDSPALLDINPCKQKSISVHWEYMFTRSQFATADMESQGRLLSRVAELVDSGSIRTTLSDTFGTINAKNLKRAHAFIESGKARGKVVLAGFDPAA